MVVLVLSQYVEPKYATELLTGDTAGLGYLLKDRVADVGDFMAALDRLAAGGTVLDPDIVGQVLARSRRRDRLVSLTARERNVLTLMAEGRHRWSHTSRSRTSRNDPGPSPPPQGSVRGVPDGHAARP